MTKLIALSDGHGMETAGKRTPSIPELNGRVIRENEFNREVVNYLDIELKRCGFKTLLVAPTDEDISLKARVELANSKGADAYISIHYNAYDGKFDDYNPEGLSVHVYPNSKEGRKLAECVLKHLKEGTPQKNRGISEDNFYVLRETKMPAILSENGFMDNKREALLMMDEDFQREVAIEHAKGICDYFNIEYKEPIDGKSMSTLYRIRKSWEDSKSQIGAYRNLDTAKSIVDKNAGYSIYDEQGVLIYPNERRSLMKLEYTRLLKKGLRGDDIKSLQIALGLLGYDSGTPDGIAGTKTDSAVRLFQKANGLTVDGLFGRQSLNKLNELLDKDSNTTSSSNKSDTKSYEILRPNKQTTIVKIPRTQIDKIDIVLANTNSNRETVGSMQKRIGADFIINGGLYWTNTKSNESHSLNLLVDEGKQSSAGKYSRFGLITLKDNSYKFDWYSWSTNTKDIIGGSPSLIIDGKIKIDKGVMENSLITSRHPRSAIGMDDKYFYLVTIDGRKPSQGLNGMTIDELAKYMLSLGCKHAINLDGGGSTRLMYGGKLLNKALENRPVHNAIGIFLK